MKDFTNLREIAENKWQAKYQIKGGKAVANEMIANYRSVYKNRRAMLEILGSF